jgi:hypothetical protein
MEACPEELVVSLEVLIVPALADQLTVLPDSAEPPEVRVATNAVVSPELRVKLDGEIQSVVKDAVDTVIVPDELPLLELY